MRLALPVLAALLALSACGGKHPVLLDTTGVGSVETIVQSSLARDPRVKELVGDVVAETGAYQSSDLGRSGIGGSSRKTSRSYFVFGTLGAAYIEYEIAQSGERPWTLSRKEILTIPDAVEQKGIRQDAASTPTFLDFKALRRGSQPEPIRVEVNPGANAEFLSVGPIAAPPGFTATGVPTERAAGALAFDITVDLDRLSLGPLAGEVTMYLSNGQAIRLPIKGELAD